MPTTEEEIFTSRKHSMDYMTVDGVILRTGYADKRIWYLVAIRELVDNAVDYLRTHYRGSSNAVIIVEVFKDDKFFHLKVRNSNENNFPVFSDANLKAMFDYGGRYGSKQDVHIINGGMLGDALKQILAFGYVLLHANDENSTKVQFIDKQWTHPLIIRHNKIEHKFILEVDKANQSIQAKEIGKKEFTGINDTEIEVILPVIDEVRNSLDREYIERFCRIYPIPTTDISFKISVIDNSDYLYSDHEQLQRLQQQQGEAADRAARDLIIGAIARGSPKGKTTIEFPALHPISTEQWNKTDSIYSYYPEEFSRRFFNIPPENRAKTTVYDVLCKWREGSNVKKDKDNEITIEELAALPKDKQGKLIKKYFNQLKSALPFPPQKLVLPYGNYKKQQQQRKAALIERLRKLYGDLNKDNDKASYKIVHGYYNNNVIQFPYFFEILAIPFANPLIVSKRIDFIGAINYSISPKEHGSLFEGDYNNELRYTDRETGDIIDIKDIFGVLEFYGFYDYVTYHAKIPCLVFANLVTPRRDPHGQDKSRIDTTPFVKTIAEGVRKMAAEIKTYKALGYHFTKPEDRRNAEKHDSGKKSIKDILTEYLIEEHGLPSYNYSSSSSSSSDDEEEEQEEYDDEEEEEDDTTT